MPLDKEDWREIQEYVETRIQARGFEIQSAKVTSVEPGRLLVFCAKEFGDTPVKWCGQHYRVFYDDETPKGTTGYAIANPPGNPYRTVRREAIPGNSAHKGGLGGEGQGEQQGKTIIPEMPNIGDPILVWRPFGRKDDLYGFAVIFGYMYV
jgi:hypothetical protein